MQVFIYTGLYRYTVCRRAPVVLQLLQGKDMLVEVFLKFLVGIVDVKLFKPIHLEAKKHVLYTDLHLLCCYLENNFQKSSDLKVLKAKDVKDADGFKVFLPFDLLVDLEDDPGETLGI